MVLTSTIIAIGPNEKSRTLIQNPSLLEYESATSVHVLAFTSHGDLLLSESQGTFDLEDWEEVYETAKTLCMSGDQDTSMQGGVRLLDEEKGSMLGFVKSAMEEKVAQDLHWHR
jgi:exosome complex component RRP46